MKDNDLLLYGALAVGGFLLYQQMSKPKVPTATSTIVPTGGTATVTQSALPVAGSSGLNTLATGLVQLFKPVQQALNPAAANNTVQLPSAATQSYNDIDAQLAEEYFTPSNPLGPSNSLTIGPAGNSFTPVTNYATGIPDYTQTLSPTMFTDNSDSLIDFSEV